MIPSNARWGHIRQVQAAGLTRPALEGAARGAQASGTPWISFYTPDEISALADEAGFPRVTCVATADLAERYLADRTDDLHAAGGEAILLAET